MRVAYLGPEGTFSHQAVLAAAGAEPVPLATVHECVVGVQSGMVERALVPIENSLEGTVRATLDALAADAPDVVIVGEAVLPIRHALIGSTHEEPRVVVSHPQATAQCARFLRRELPGATVLAASSTAEAVRMVAEGRVEAPAAAIGTLLAASLYGARVLREGIEDDPSNETRFVWLAPAGTPPAGGAGPWRTSIVWWGAGTNAPGWLVRCLSEFAFRGVNLTRIESRPRREGLGSYLFFADCDGRADDGSPVADAIAALRGQAEVVRVLGSYPAAQSRSGR